MYKTEEKKNQLHLSNNSSEREDSIARSLNEKINYYKLAPFLQINTF